MRRVRKLAFALALASLVHLSMRAVAQAPAGLAELLEDQGPPSVMVEPERPERSEDRRAVALVISRLADLGVRAVDGEAFRGKRRTVTDGAGARGLDADDARAALDRVEADFVLRVSVAISDAGSSESYGMRIERRGCVLAPTLLRVPDQAVLAVEAAAAESGSSAPAAAEESARQSAADALARSVAEAVRSDWQAASEGRRAWIVEIEGGDADPRAALDAIGAGGATVLEHVPHGRTVIRADAGTVMRLRAQADRIRVLRPGYVRLSPAVPVVAGQEPGAGLVGASIAAALVAAVVLAWTVRSRRASRSAAPGD